MSGSCEHRDSDMLHFPLPPFLDPYLNSALYANSKPEIAGFLSELLLNRKGDRVRFLFQQSRMEEHDLYRRLHTLKDGGLL